MTSLSDKDLLTKLIGARESRRLYRGSLQPLFAPPAAGPEQNEICAAARELVTRWLNEELRRECSLAEKPELSLLPATTLKDANVLAKLYLKLTGREPTKEELEAAQKRLDSKQS